ncbi:collagenase-like [Lucilia sericata]|uniref:collagenase-like n=1 Tax=Lucilia sericata TaxID=13632 RepID=UPI0018A879C7|nr:collagenase-like [Lucilia sericata]
MKGLLTKVVTLGIINQIYLNAEEFNSQNVAIISGQRAQIGQFPWHVLLWLGEIDYERGICGGSIISNNWVLTTAGCVYESYSVDLVFGTIELNKNNITMTSTVIIIHPEFNREVLTNNIALIELPTTLEFSDIIQPIQLMSLAEISRNFTGVEVIITGFGRSEQKIQIFPIGYYGHL